MTVESFKEGWVCPHCNKARGPDGVDPCLGILPGVKAACCGHGGHLHSSINGYIYFTNGKVVRFTELTEVEDYSEDKA
jgi:hypothetical protein